MTGTEVVAEANTIAQAFLNDHAPFDRFPRSLRDYFLDHVQLMDYSAGDVILEPGSGRVRHFYLIVSGGVAAERPGVGEEGVERFELEAGDNFPMAAMIGQRATRTFYRAATDVRCLRLPRPAFEHLLGESPAFRDYCMRGVSSLLDQVQRDIQQHAAGNLGGDSSLETALRGLMQSDPLTCAPEAAIHKAVRSMHEHEVGSILVTDTGRRAKGIFTLHDLRAVVADGVDLESPLSAVMTPDPLSLDADTYAFEAVVEMARHHIRHMVVTDDRGRLAGIVSERDIFALQRINLVHLTRAITAAGSVEALVRARSDVGALIDTMMAHGAGVEQITRIITLLNDRTVTRAIELSIEEQGDPGVPFTWIAFGSEGRSEQTRVTDQDNGILFDPGDEATETVRQRILPLAWHINQVLDRCGFTLCTGNVMASNPRLCLSFAEWEQTFREMVGSATPENLLNSTIYFDFRPIWGDLPAGDALHQRVADLAAGNSVFLHTLAGNCLAIRPPLGMFRDFSTEKDTDGVERIDLKVRGLTPFVDAARVLALQAGIAESNTPARYRALVSGGVLSAEDAGAFQRSFAFIQLLRMREHQRQAAAGESMNNRLDPDELNPMDRRILKEALREARRLQKKLEVRFQL
ncbi:putative nucleotidyltransferase substrate binding domain-containing protein [Spiribacter pallidus]|uniref:Nucleotidyltransferase substrate binding domain-containing protein n=1 Tax=Spiribacter pallidus TaxID=1987936 RepID=A0ABV3TCR6_9GAMM